MTTRTLDFADGFQSASAPTTGVISVGGIKVFASDAAYVADKGVAAAEGDMYFNSTTNFVRIHDGSGFIELVDSSAAQSIGGDKTLTGTTTFINSTNLNVSDKNISVNQGGNDASAEGAGLTVKRTTTDGSLVYENTLASKWKAGAVGAEIELVNVSSTQTLSGKTMAAGSNTFSGFLHGTQVDNPSTGVHGVTGSVVGTTDTQALTNKDYDGGTASNTSRITLPKASTATLSGLTRKQGTVVYDTTLNIPLFDTGSALQNFSSTASLNRLLENVGVSNSVAASAWTITLTQSDGSTAPTSGSPSRIAFRSTTITSGAYSIQSFTATASLTVPSGATLEHTSGATNYAYLSAIYDGTNLELAVSSFRPDETALHNTTALSAASDSGDVLYSTTARTNCAVRVLARLTSVQTTAGTYAATATAITVQHYKDDVFTQTLDASSSGDISAAQPVLTIYRDGRVVTLYVPSLAHASLNSAATATGFIPAAYRPLASISQIATHNGSVTRQMTVNSNGQLAWGYRDWAGSATNQTDTGGAMVVSWITKF